MADGWKDAYNSKCPTIASPYLMLLLTNIIINSNTVGHFSVQIFTVCVCVWCICRYLQLVKSHEETPEKS